MANPAVRITKLVHINFYLYNKLIIKLYSDIMHSKIDRERYDIRPYLKHVPEENKKGLIDQLRAIIPPSPYSSTVNVQQNVTAHQISRVSLFLFFLLCSFF